MQWIVMGYKTNIKQESYMGLFKNGECALILSPIGRENDDTHHLDLGDAPCSVTGAENHFSPLAVISPWQEESCRGPIGIRFLKPHENPWCHQGKAARKSFSQSCYSYKNPSWPSLSHGPSHHWFNAIFWSLDWVENLGLKPPYLMDLDGNK